MDDLPWSEACERNRGPIAARLGPLLAHANGLLLELGSGTGQHAVSLAAELPNLTWQPTDIAGALPGLASRVRTAGTPNILPPLELDVGRRPWPVATACAVFTANTLHIMAWPLVESFMAGVGEVLAPGGILAIYGPFRYRGQYTSESNAAFDQWLRARDPASGIRDFESVDGLARDQGLVLEADHVMPANNQFLVWRRGAGGTRHKNHPLPARYDCDV